MLNKDTLELIQTTAQKAHTPFKIDLPGDGRTVTLALGGEIQTVAIPPANRGHTIGRLSDLIAFAKIVEDDESEQWWENAVIWHNRDQVVLLLNDSDRRDRVMFPLTKTPAYSLLEKMAEQPAVFDQKGFVRSLKTLFRVDNPQTIGLFKRLEWKTVGAGVGEVGRGRESLSKSMLAEVQGTAELPEELAVVVPIYREIGEQDLYTVTCCLDYDVPNARIIMAPLAGELDAVMNTHQAMIRERLIAAFGQSKSVRVYEGRP